MSTAALDAPCGVDAGLDEGMLHPLRTREAEALGEDLGIAAFTVGR